MRIILGGIGMEPSRLAPFHDLQLQLVPWIPHSSIAKTILQIPNFYIFTHVENQPLKQRLKQKQRIIMTNERHIFSFA